MEEILSSIRRIIADEETDEGRAEDEGKTATATQENVEAGSLGALEVLEDDDEEDEDGGDVLELTSVVDENQPVAEPVDDDLPLSTTLELVDDDEDEDVDDVQIELDDVDDLPEIEALTDEEIIETEQPILEVEETLADEAILEVDDPEEDTIAIDEIISEEDDIAVSTKKAETEALLSTGTASTTTGAFAKLSKAFRPTPVEESVADGAGRTVEQFIEDMARPMLKEWLDENMPAIVERLVQKEIQKIARRAELL